jgi:hypothetical protein
LGISEREEKQKGTGNILETVMTANFPKFMLDANHRFRNIREHKTGEIYFKKKMRKKNQTQDWRCNSSGREPALQAQSPEFKPLPYPSSLPTTGISECRIQTSQTKDKEKNLERSQRTIHTSTGPQVKIISNFSSEVMEAKTEWTETFKMVR